MTIFLFLDLSLALVFFLIGLRFFTSDGSAAKYLTGYNMKSEEERKRFDEKEMCKAYGKRILVWAVPFAAGAAVDIRFYGVGFSIALIVWIVLFVLLLIERHNREQ